jgi:hypothetical protein
MVARRPILKALLVATAFVSFGSVMPALALDSADVLPAHVNSPAIRMGQITGIGERYTANGSLVTLSDYNSIVFDAKKLASIEPRVQQLVGVLNQFGRQNMGSELTLGTLHLDINPEVNYIAPVHAFGITKKWTVGVGLPVIRYTNNISMYQSGSNLEQIRAQTGGLSSQLDSAFDELNVSLTTQAQKELASKGYRPLDNHNDTFLGDVQIASLYQLYDDKTYAVLAKTMIGLPTGPSDDPDDLADLGTFGFASVEQSALVTYRMRQSLRFSAKAALKYTLPDKIVKRVPTDENDSLPGAESKENVSRSTGILGSIGASTSYFFLRRWSAGAGLDFLAKAADSYSGKGSGRYDLLANETNSNATRVRLGVSYDTISAYFAKAALIPAVLSYEFSDTIRGFNTERQTIHELTLTLFF